MKTALKYLMLSSILALNGVSLPAYAQSASPILSPQSHTTYIDVKFKGYLFGFRVMRAHYKTTYTDTQYQAHAELKTSGLGAFLKKFKIWATTSGQFQSAGLRPQSHVQQNENKKNRRVQMLYNDNKVNVNIVPPIWSQGTPPASPKQRFESDDTLSALLNLMMRGYKTSTEPCTGSVAVFDSKQHYNLRMERKGMRRISQSGYKGDTIRCHVYYEAVSGFDADDLPSDTESAAPIVMYLANFKDAELYIPVRITYKISGFKAVIKAREISIHKAENTHIYMPQTMEDLAGVTHPFDPRVNPAGK